uniref:IS3 family transposase n=1 Tax=Microtetraspora fusca TaxID=1997 RepID=UPI0009FF5A18|nr:IS3 family transposase [Microtetraspora fusca]
MVAAEGLPIQVCCRVLDVSESGYYACRSRPPSARSLRHAWLTEKIQQLHAASRGVYGARRVHAELTLGNGLIVAHGTVEMLMRREGIQGLPGSRRERPVAQVPTAADPRSSTLTPTSVLRRLLEPGQFTSWACTRRPRGPGWSFRWAP